jgi:hypothetical protein
MTTVTVGMTKGLVGMTETMTGTRVVHTQQIPPFSLRSGVGMTRLFEMTRRSTTGCHSEPWVSFRTVVVIPKRGVIPNRCCHSEPGPRPVRNLLAQIPAWLPAYPSPRPNPARSDCALRSTQPSFPGAIF